MRKEDEEKKKKTLLSCDDVFIVIILKIGAGLPLLLIVGWWTIWMKNEYIIKGPGCELIDTH